MLRSPLHDLHIELGAKMGPFAGYEMPLWYPQKIVAEHKHTRSQASLFDISHMGQASIVGEDSATELERLIPTDLKSLPKHKMHYCCFTDEGGGILDDLVIASLGQDYFLVMNAACKEQDLKYLRENVTGSAVLEHTENALIALQGPKAREVLNRLTPEICDLQFMTMGDFAIRGVPCIVSRSGYTGEDGFEISMAAETAMKLAKELLNEPEVMPAGLGARDSLRLEAGLRLYGQDMDTTTTPVEAGIQWTISKSRRMGGERAGGFPGAEIILDQLTNGTSRRFVGILPQGRAPARNGTDICLGDDNIIGKVTSGLFAPSVAAPIAMGYVDRDFAAPDTAINLLIRGKPQPAKIVRLPFVKHRYFNTVKIQSKTNGGKPNV